jgi:hypothetical protein
MLGSYEDARPKLLGIGGVQFYEIGEEHWYRIWGWKLSENHPDKHKHAVTYIYMYIHVYMLPIYAQAI